MTSEGDRGGAPADLELDQELATLGEPGADSAESEEAARLASGGHGLAHGLQVDSVLLRCVPEEARVSSRVRRVRGLVLQTALDRPSPDKRNWRRVQWWLPGLSAACALILWWGLRQQESGSERQAARQIPQPTHELLRVHASMIGKPDADRRDYEAALSAYRLVVLDRLEIR